MSYFDTQLPTELTVDASPVGLGAILSQTTPSGEQKIVAFASKALNPTEQRYSQFEREALAVLWSCDHFRIFILGKPVTVYTDHRPLESVFNGRTLHPNLRIQKWVARAQPYGITVKHIPVSTNPADYMSRHPIDDDYLSAAARSANRFVNFVAQQSTPKAFKLVDVATVTTEDPALTAVIKAIKTGDWSKLRSTQPKYYKIRNDLTTALNDSILMRNRQLCLPQKLQDRALRLAHETHMGMTKTKRMLREKVYFPGITARIEEMIRCCPACQLCTDDSIRPPISSSKLPERPWQEVSCDYYTLSNNDEVLVVIDDYSRYPEVEPVTTTSGRVAINKLSNILPDLVYQRR